MGDREVEDVLGRAQPLRQLDRFSSGAEVVQQPVGLGNTGTDGGAQPVLTQFGEKRVAAQQLLERRHRIPG